MNTRDAHSLIDSKPCRRTGAEVDDFVDFLRSREDDRHLATAAAKTAEPAFAEVSDNDDDGEYDRL